MVYTNKWFLCKEQEDNSFRSSLGESFIRDLHDLVHSTTPGSSQKNTTFGKTENKNRVKAWVVWLWVQLLPVWQSEQAGPLALKKVTQTSQKHIQIQPLFHKQITVNKREGEKGRRPQTGHVDCAQQGWGGGRGCLVSTSQKYWHENALPLPKRITSNLNKTMHAGVQFSALS